MAIFMLEELNFAIISISLILFTAKLTVPFIALEVPKIEPSDEKKVTSSLSFNPDNVIIPFLYEEMIPLTETLLIFVASDVGSQYKVAETISDCSYPSAYAYTKILYFPSSLREPLLFPLVTSLSVMLYWYCTLGVILENIIWSFLYSIVGTEHLGSSKIVSSFFLSVSMIFLKLFHPDVFLYIFMHP